MKCMNSGIYFLCVSIFLFNCDSKLLGQATGLYPINEPNYSYFQEDDYTNLYLNFLFDRLYFPHGESFPVGTNPPSQNQIKLQLGYISIYEGAEGPSSTFHPFANSNI